MAAAAKKTLSADQLNERAASQALQELFSTAIYSSDQDFRGKTSTIIPWRSRTNFDEHDVSSVSSQPASVSVYLTTEQERHKLIANKMLQSLEQEFGKFEEETPNTPVNRRKEVPLVHREENGLAFHLPWSLAHAKAEDFLQRNDERLRVLAGGTFAERA